MSDQTAATKQPEPLAGTSGATPATPEGEDEGQATAMEEILYQVCRMWNDLQIQNFHVLFCR